MFPTGGYKLSGQENTRDVYVDFTTNQIDTTPKISYDTTFPSVALAGLPITGTVTIQNVGSTLVPGQLITITSLLTPTHQTNTTDPIPPFGFTTSQVLFNKTDILTNTTSPIRIQVAGNTQTKIIRIYPFFFQNTYIQIGEIILGILSFGLLIIAARAWCLSILRPKG